MVRKLKIIILLFIFSFCKAYGQTTLLPLDLAKKIFSKSKFIEIKKYSTDEYNGHPNGNDISKKAKLQFSLLEQTSDKAVVVMTILDKPGKGLDTYLHFSKEKIWKVCAFRALAMTGMIEKAKTELEKLSSKTVDSLISISKNDTSEYSMFKSREDFDFQLGNMTLTLALDSEIINHFIKNKIEFEQLKDIALRNLDTIKPNKERRIKLCKGFETNFHKLFISSIETGDYMLGQSISFLIGGMLDNTVGYIYVKDKKDVPKMNPRRIIMLREIGNGWYIYKTT
jgi:hypothetical protein